jgi:hypothetical protein
MPKRMKATLRDAKPGQQRMKLPFPNQAVIPWRAHFRCKQQTQRIWSPSPQVKTQTFHQSGRDGQAAIALAGFHRLDLAAPHTLTNVNHGIFQVHVRNP